MSLLILRRGLSEIFNTMSRMCYELVTERETFTPVASSYEMRVPSLGSQTTAEREEGTLGFADLALNTRTRDVRRGQRLIELTRTEFRLLELFLLNPRQVLTRELIFDRVWGFDFGPTSNTLSVYVGYLRRKTEAEGEPRLIHTIRGIGYMLRD